MDLSRRLRLAIRVLLRDWRVTVFAMLALALGIGLATTAFSIVRGTFFRSLPFADANRLVRVESTNVNGRRLPVTIRDFADWRSMQTSFAGLAAWVGVGLNTSGGGTFPMHYNGAYVTANFFKVTGVGPALGRGFLPSEGRPGARAVAVISDSLWHQRFGANPEVLGQSIRIYGQPTTIVGVMPPGFRFPLNQYVWVPFRIDPSKFARGKSWPLQVIGRLKRGISIEQANSELSTICARLAREYPDTNRGIGAALTPFVRGYTNLDNRRAYLLIFALAAGLLLIAVTNVANLLLGRSAMRSKEMALRMALGGTRPQVISQVLLESILLALGGAVVGLGIAWAGVHFYALAIQYRPGPFWQAVRLDTQSYIFAAIVTVASGLLSGLFPALRCARENTAELLRDAPAGSTSRRTGRLGKGLVVLQVALSYALLLATALMAMSLSRINDRKIGFNAAGILSAHLSLYGKEYPDGASQRRAFEDLSSRISRLPSIDAVGLTSSVPGGRNHTAKAYFEVEGESYPSKAERPVTRWSVVTPGFFSVLGARLLRGRLLETSDDADTAPVAVVSRTLAESFFPKGNPIGRRIRIDLGDGRSHRVRVVGVINDVLIGTSEDNDYRAVFLPFAQNPQPGMDFLLRTRVRPASVEPAVREEVASFNPDLPLSYVKPLQAVLAEDVRSYTIAGGLVSTFGSIALVLAILGVYALLTLQVQSRERDAGIRMALGAGPLAVARGVLVRAWVMVGLGLAIGLALAMSFSRALAALLFGVKTYDPTSYVVAALSLIIAATVASLPPIFRALRVDPMAILRLE